MESTKIGELCLEDTAKQAGVKLSVAPYSPDAALSFIHYRSLNESGLRMYREQYFEVRINEALTEVSRAQCMAHELGHLLLFSCGYDRPINEEEWYFQERFSEYFARKMILAGGGTLAYEPPLSGADILGQEQLFNTKQYIKV